MQAFIDSIVIGWLGVGLLCPYRNRVVGWGAAFCPPQVGHCGGLDQWAMQLDHC